MKNHISRRAATSPFATDLSTRLDEANDRLGIQDTPALQLAKSDAEIQADRELAERVRAQERDERKAAGDFAARKATRQRKFAEQAEEIELADRLDALRAQRDFRRASDPHAMTARLHRMGRRLPAVLVGTAVVGTIWSGVNVQHNLFPVAAFTDPLYWISFGFEALISVPLIVVMVTTAMAAQRGREVNRRKVIGIEVALLSVSIMLNVGPHIGHGWRELLEYGLAPVMVAVSVWLHPWVSSVFAGLIADAITTPQQARELHAVTTAA